MDILEISLITIYFREVDKIMKKFRCRKLVGPDTTRTSSLFHRFTAAESLLLVTDILLVVANDAQWSFQSLSSSLR